MLCALQGSSPCDVVAMRYDESSKARRAAAMLRVRVHWHAMGAGYARMPRRPCDGCDGCELCSCAS